MMDMSKRVGQFVGVAGDRLVRASSDRQYRIILYGAYDAMGLIGPEYNGIAVLDETDKHVVIRDHMRSESGYFGPSSEQVIEFERLCELTGDELEDFCRSIPGNQLRDEERIETG